MQPIRDQLTAAPRQTPTPLAQLAEAIRAIESGPRRSERESSRGLLTGWGSGADEFISHLHAGCVHEWYGSSVGSEDSREGGGWVPPVGLMVHLAWRAIDSVRGLEPGRPSAGIVLPKTVWIGRRCWPYPPVLTRPAEADARSGSRGAGTDRSLLDASIFVDPPDAAARVWAADLALRAGDGIGLVIVDAQGLDMAGSRRLQLAAEAAAMNASAGGGGLGLLLRPAEERRQISAAATRWLVRTHPTGPDDHESGASAGGKSPGNRAAGEGEVNPRWTVELRRCKGMRLPPEGRREWTLELDHRACRVVCLPPEPAHRPAEKTRRAV